MNESPGDRLTSQQAARLAGLSYATWQSRWLIHNAKVKRPTADGAFPDTSLPYWLRSTVERFARQRATSKRTRERDSGRLHARIMRADPVGLRAREELAARIGVSAQTIYRHQLRHAAGECPCAQAKSA